jgi:protein involved in polysaccharide export with SLBB domain
MKRLTLQRTRAVTGLLGLLLASTLSGGPTSAAPYKLVPGDTVSVDIFGEQAGWTTDIDIDGAVRLPGFGSITLEGMTLDEAEAALAKAIRATDLYVAPRVSVSVTDYAQIVVTGAVRQPGAFDYTPYLTVEGAIGLANGLAYSAAMDSVQMALTTAQFSGDLRTIATEIQRSVVRSARIDALLAGQSRIDRSKIDQFGFGKSDTGLLEELIETEQAQLEEQIALAEEVVRLRQAELEETETQIVLFDQRIDVQNTLMALQETERAAQEELDARGLRTRMDMARLERSDADVQARLLEIESALSQARSRRLAILRAIAQFKADMRIENLSTAASERTDLELLLNRRRTVLEKIYAVGDTSAAASIAQDGPRPIYTIRRRVQGEIQAITATSGDALLPGDTLIVTLELDTGSEATAGMPAVEGN